MKTRLLIKDTFPLPGQSLRLGLRYDFWSQGSRCACLYHGIGWKQGASDCGHCYRSLGQVREFIRVMWRTKEAMADQEERLLAHRVDAKGHRRYRRA